MMDLPGRCEKHRNVVADVCPVCVLDQRDELLALVEQVEKVACAACDCMDTQTIRDGDWVIVFSEYVDRGACLMRVNYTPANPGEWYHLQTQGGEVLALNPASPDFHGMKLAEPPPEAPDG